MKNATDIAYAQGFSAKCAACGVGPEQLLKQGGPYAQSIVNAAPNWSTNMFRKIPLIGTDAVANRKASPKQKFGWRKQRAGESGSISAPKQRRGRR